MGRTGKSTARQGATVPTTMLYEVLVVANGGDGERFTIERDAPFSDSDTPSSKAPTPTGFSRSSPVTDPWTASSKPSG
jgi:hypothetical protein